jgi:hypothetical protein
LVALVSAGELSIVPDTTGSEKPAQELPPKASLAVELTADVVKLAPVAEAVETELSQLPKAVEKAPHELVKLPATVVKQLPVELGSTEAYVEAKLPMIEALPLPDIVFGGGVLVAVVILQAIGMRLLVGRFDKRAQRIEQRSGWWSVDLLLGFTVFRMLGLHLMSIILWSAALVYGGIIPEWAAAARFAAMSYTTLGPHRVLSDEWDMLSPIIAISGMFTFAWTASVLVNIVGKCNELRALAREARHHRRDARSHATVTAPPGDPEAGAFGAGASRTW